MNYDEAISYIKNTAKFGMNFGLGRTEKILELLGDPHKKIKCVHVAGTNGKGSTTAMITSILKAAGYKVGMYTSPYIQDFEERIQINGENIPKSDLTQVIEQVAAAVNEVLSLGYEDPTEFEIITCAMFLYFQQQQVDAAVIEVGLGGRLDSTNVIKPLVSVITSISHDHMNILGNSLEEIAKEKCGIIKESVPVVVYPQKSQVDTIIHKTAEEKSSEVIRVDESRAQLVDVIDYKQLVNISGRKNFYEVKLPLLGEHQILNCLTAVTAVEKLIDLGFHISKDNIEKGIASTVWIGRMEIMQKNPVVVIDGAHNIDGINKLAANIKKYFHYEKMFLIIGILGDKQVDEMLQSIVPLAEKVIALTPHNERAADKEILKDSILKITSQCETYEDYKEAYEKAISWASEKDLIVICGSLYMIGDIRKVIKNA